jgi:hypothetical protein
VVGVNELILKKIDSSGADEKTKKILKDLLLTEFMNQLNNNKTYYDQYDDILSKNVGEN